MTNEIVKKEKQYTLKISNDETIEITEAQRDHLWRALVENPQMSHFKIGDSILQRNLIRSVIPRTGGNYYKDVSEVFKD